MYIVQPDFKQDDGALTPKKFDDKNSTKDKSFFHKSIPSDLSHQSLESTGGKIAKNGNGKNGKNDTQKIITINDDKNVMAMNTSAASTIHEEEQMRKKVKKNVTVFPNDKKNVDTILHQQDYEENEAPPPKLDSYAHDGVITNGQYLFKN